MVENAGKMEKEYIKKVKLSLISRSKNIYIYLERDRWRIDEVGVDICSKWMHGLYRDARHFLRG